jgi:hypothetical protein
VQERSPRIRRIALAIKSEDFSRRITPPPSSAPDMVGKTLGAEQPELGAIVAGDGSTLIRLNEAAPTELQ